MITRSFKKQILNSYKNTEIKHPDVDKLFFVFIAGFLLEVSIIKKKLYMISGKSLIIILLQWLKHLTTNYSLFVMILVVLKS